MKSFGSFFGIMVAAVALIGVSAGPGISDDPAPSPIVAPVVTPVIPVVTPPVIPPPVADDYVSIEGDLEVLPGGTAWLVAHAPKGWDTEIVIHPNPGKANYRVTQDALSGNYNIDIRNAKGDAYDVTVLGFTVSEGRVRKERADWVLDVKGPQPPPPVVDPNVKPTPAPVDPNVPPVPPGPLVGPFKVLILEDAMKTSALKPGQKLLRTNVSFRQWLDKKCGEDGWRMSDVKVAPDGDNEFWVKAHANQPGGPLPWLFVFGPDPTKPLLSIALPDDVPLTLAALKPVLGD